jgi:siderophore synthetase component
VVFEAHAQNLLVRFDKQTKAILGFVVRDLAGLRIYPPTLRQSIGVDFQFLPGHCVATETLEETFPKFYHTFIHTHLQRLIRVLDLHYNGIGWGLLRQHLKEVIPIGHALEKAWLDPSATQVPSKCLMKMRLQDSYRVVCI